MSRVFTKNIKELAGVRVTPAEEVWELGKNNKPQIKKDIVLYGKVEAELPNLVLKVNKPERRTDYVEDVSALPKRTKSELVKHFYNERGKRNKRTVAYLVRSDREAKKEQIKNAKNKK